MGHMYANKKKVGEELIFWESHKQALVANWIDVEDHYFEPPALKLISLLSSNKAIDDVGESNGVDRVIDELSQVLDVYEAQLGRFKYLASDKFTVADVLHLPNLHSLMGIASTKKLIDSRPHVSAWCSEILARPSWTKVLQMKKQKMISLA
uniref:glutathione S-transferase PARB-like isoform X1 n=1 Tax=Fragaria vesca subsp. vesca TaxID=101020 RepID=UPI0005CA43B5|nr:PREDICTED: glutathione S-transferase PARB-like isoform X1 [Fragaria vesca subsp. vesca]